MPFKNDLWIAARVFDLYYTPEKLAQDVADIKLGVDWVYSIRAILRIFMIV